MTSLDTPISSIRAYGYNLVEARFLHLVATHSGYFLRRQFVAYSRRPWDYCGSRFGNKLIARRQGRCIRLAAQGQVFSLCSRCIYKAANAERLRAHRDHSVSQIETRLAILDFVLSKVPNKPTLPFTREEMISILTALGPYGKSAGLRNGQRLKAFVLLLRYSGMRIGDAVQLGVNRLQGNKLLLHTEKTGVHVYCVLPDIVTKALDAAPRSSQNYFFWSGKSTVRSAKGKWQRRLQRLFEFAGVVGGHAHRFRDTFAVELLLAGVPLDRVSVLLGHSSIRITERHYAPWTRSRQEQIEADLHAAWRIDPIALGKTKSTKAATISPRRLC